MKSTDIQNEDEEENILDAGEAVSTDVSESQSPESNDVNLGQEKYKALSGQINEWEKKRMVYSIFASMLVCGTLYLNIASFYPLFVD